MEKVITNANFNETISASKVALVDFWAVWCGPCRMLSPTVDDIAAEYDGRITVAKCNVDDCQDVASQFGLRSIPTLIFFKDGQPVERLVGVVSKAEITKIIDSLI